MNYILGGSTTPMAGDGYGYRPSPANSPTPSNILASDEPDDADQHRVSSLTMSRDGSPIFSSQMSGLNAPVQPPRSSVKSYHTASEYSAISEIPDRPEEMTWQNYDIPQELGLLEEDSPMNIRNVIQESMDEHRAIKDSLLHSRMEGIEPSTGNIAFLSNDYDPGIAQSSSTASTRSTVSSDLATTNLYLDSKSETSMESDAEDDSHLKPSHKISDQLTAGISKELLPSNSPSDQNVPAKERRFLESKARIKKTQKRFRLLPNGKQKGESSSESPVIDPPVSECTGCFEGIPGTKAVGLPCHHEYCSSCFAQLVSTSIQHEVSFPPKCCLTDIPNKTIRDNLPAEISSMYDNKALEYAVPVANRYYCISSACGKWIDTRQARRRNGILECQHCASMLCTICRGPQHPSNEDCPQDLGLDRTLEQAERAGWRRCYKCRAMVELNTGCRHITCKCRAEFW